MAFQNGYVVSLVNDRNQPVREFNENNQRVARVPFNTEYKIRIKNKTNKRCYVKVEIDGMDIDSEGRRLIFGPSQELDLERFVDSLNSGRKFKFISADSSECQDPTSKDNGKVKVTFYPEYILPQVNLTTPYSPPFWLMQPQWVYSSTCKTNAPLDVQCSTNNANSTSFVNGIGPITARGISTSDVGATAAGGHSDQKFSASSEFFTTEAPVVIEIMMKGPHQEARQSWVIDKTGYGSIEKVWFEGVMLRDADQAFITTESTGQYLVLRVPLERCSVTGSGSNVG